jgi:hypothetical protein
MMKAFVSSALLLVHAAGEQANAQAFASNLLFGTTVKMAKPADFTVTSSKGVALTNGQLPKKSDGSRFATLCAGSTSSSVFTIEGEGSFTAESSSNSFVVTSTANEVTVAFSPDAATGAQHEATVTITDDHGDIFTFMVGGAVSKGMLAVYDQVSEEVVFTEKVDFGKNAGSSKILSVPKTVTVKNVDLKCPVTFDGISVTKNNEKYGDSYETIERKGFNIGFSVGNKQLSYPYEMELQPEEDVSVTISFIGKQTGSTGVRFAGEYQVTQSYQGEELDPFVFAASACINCPDEEEDTEETVTEETNDTTETNSESESFVCDADGSSGWIDGYAADPYTCAQYNVNECKYAANYKSTQSEFLGLSALDICCVCQDGGESTVETTTAADDVDAEIPDGCEDDNDWVDSYHLTHGGTEYGCHNWYKSASQGCDDTASNYENEGKTGLDACCKCKALL